MLKLLKRLFQKKKKSYDDFLLGRYYGGLAVMSYVSDNNQLITVGGKKLTVQDLELTIRALNDEIRRRGNGKA